MIQIRHVNSETHEKLKRRASLEGMTLSDFLKKEIEKIVDRPTLEEITKRILKREKISIKDSPAKLIRAERDSR